MILGWVCMAISPTGGVFSYLVQVFGFEFMLKTKLKFKSPCLAIAMLYTVCNNIIQ